MCSVHSGTASAADLSAKPPSEPNAFNSTHIRNVIPGKEYLRYRLLEMGEETSPKIHKLALPNSCECLLYESTFWALV